MLRPALFLIISLLLTFLSRKALSNWKSHGFYRFFAFEGILVLILLNLPYWTTDPHTPVHVLSSALLFVSIYFVVNALIMLKKRGGNSAREDSPENFGFENTVTIVKEGLYRHVRHPMYSSLLFLGWGALFKDVTPLNLCLAVTVSALLFVTAKVEEQENSLFFGDDYTDYKQQTKMFIPWLL
ncbi:MAG: isoprenylcysteine carboxylmethyltransferase family protein [Gammaproteobacteria bacterium]|nr:MAG: isoprenylcysteine carboxylmethyltransferase family protein [Gammaproteobacteria bacterium]RLA13022.1 MAG: isoprenylcysteine carboxylmethyltransferase family protein [Gammaproteobacteria bacterium]RLA16749.1 MAG: isoprenylcysteine carboxylmethyltransferase family protein [Gammaproteobacteria bacterium]